MRKLLKQSLLPVLLIGVSQVCIANESLAKNEELVNSYQNVGMTFLTCLFLLIITMFVTATIQYYLKLLKSGLTSEQILGFSLTRTKYDKDELTDHHYDGIQELDNRMPPWLKYMFMFTITFSTFYLFHFLFLGTGDLQIAEYNKELQTAEQEISAFQLKSASFVDENTAKPSIDANMLNKGNEVFKKNCAVCHGQSAEGATGPNLTDQYWIHGGEFKSIFKTIKNGVNDKGMPTWKQSLSPAQILQVASYIRTLKGTVQNGKDKQGELYTGKE